MSPFSSPTIGQHFAFAHGRIGTLKQMLLTQSDIDRLLGAHGSAGVEQIFIELKISKGIDQGIRDGDAVLQAIGSWMRREVEAMTPLAKQPIFSILWLEGDAPLLAYLLKKYHGFTSEISTLPTSGFSAYDPTMLRMLVENGVTGDLPSHLVAFVDEVKTMENPDPKRIDTAVAQYVANTRLRLARTSGSKDIRRFVQHGIDIQNIRTALRLAAYDASETLPYLLKGGTVDVKKLATSKQTILDAVKHSDLSYHLSDLLSKHDLDVNAIEQALTQVTAADIARMWNIPLSIEPLFAFASITSMDLKLMRVILMGKRNELSPQELKKALPPFISASHYVLS